MIDRLIVKIQKYKETDWQMKDMKKEKCRRVNSDTSERKLKGKDNSGIKG